MLFSDAPYVPGIQAAAKLRTEASKLQSKAAVIWKSGGGRAMAEVLVRFWQDQKARIALPNGSFHDGVYLGLGNEDIRGLCYKVLAHHRLYPNAQDRADLEAFCDYFIMAAFSLDDARSQVDSLVVKPLYDNDGFFSNPPNAVMRFEVTFLDATGHLVPISADHPALGTVDIKYSAEGHKDFVGKYRGFFLKPTTNPWVMDRGTVNDSSHEGANTITVKYTADIEPPLEQLCPYQRGVPAAAGAPAAASVVEEEVKTEAPTGKNGF